MEKMLKICRKCLIEKDINLFYNSKKNKDGKFSSCKICDKIKYNNWRKNNPEIRSKTRKREWLKKRYEMRIDEYDRMVKIQNNRCYICEHSPKKTDDPRTLNLQVDHCHKTNKIRKLLCHQCNRALGLLKEDPNIFLKCISYIQEHI